MNCENTGLFCAKKLQRLLWSLVQHVCSNDGTLYGKLGAGEAHVILVNISHGGGGWEKDDHRSGALRLHLQVRLEGRGNNQPKSHDSNVLAKHITDITPRSNLELRGKITSSKIKKKVSAVRTQTEKKWKQRQKIIQSSSPLEMKLKFTRSNAPNTIVPKVLLNIILNRWLKLIQIKKSSTIRIDNFEEKIVHIIIETNVRKYLTCKLNISYTKRWQETKRVFFIIQETFYS